MPKKRLVTYDNSGRLEKSNLTQQHVLQAFVELLVSRRGEEVQIHEIAKKSGVSERTIFRFFKDKKSIHEATDAYVMGYLQSGIQTMEDRGIIEFTKNIFILFDQNENLVLAYLHSPFGKQARAIMRQKLNHILMQKILKDKKISSPEQQAQLSLVVSLINARLWDDMRSDFSMSGKEIGETVAWAVKILIAKL